MKINNINSTNRILHGGTSTGEHRRKCQDDKVYNNDRPAKATAPSGSERLNKKNELSFTGDPKHIQHIAENVLKKSNVDVAGWTNKLGQSDKFNKVLESVNKNEAFYESAVALIVAGMLKPICVLAMPGAEKEDKQMAATKNFVSAMAGFAISNSIMAPVSAATNKIIKSFDSPNPTQYIKDKNYVDLLKSMDRNEGAKSTLGDAFKSTFKKFPDLGIAPIKAAVTIALTPIVLKAIFGKDKKSSKKEPKSEMQTPIMDLIKLDKNKNSNTKTNTSFSGNNQNQQISFTGNPFKMAAETLSEPLAKGLGKLATTGPAKWVVEQTAKFEKPSARWSDLASIAITLFYMGNTWKSEKIDEERKLPLMINNGLVTIASSGVAFLIDKYTDKPVDDVLTSYLVKHEKDLHAKSNKHITGALSTMLDKMKAFANPDGSLRSFEELRQMAEMDGADKKLVDFVNNAKNDLEHLTKNGGDIIKNGVKTEEGLIGEAISKLNESDIIKSAIKSGIIDDSKVKEMAAAGFNQQASKVFNNISKTKSLTIFTITVRFLVTVLMTPVIGKIVAFVNKKLGRDPKGRKIKPKPDLNNIGMKDYMNSLKK